MAYGLIKFGEFKDYNGILYVINIFKKDYVGSNSSFTLASDGFTLNYKGQGNDYDAPFKMSELEFTFYSESAADDTFILDAVNGDEGDYTVQVTKQETTGGSVNTFWRGVLIVDNADLSDLYYPQPFKLRAIDGISLLKGKKVTELTNLYNVDGGVSGGVTEDFQIDVAGGPTYGGSVYQHRSLVLACLRLIPWVEQITDTETFVYNYGCWENTKITNQIDVRYDPLRSAAIRSDVFYTQSNTGEYLYGNCFDMLRDILSFYNIRCYMEGGFFVNIQVGVYEEMKTASNFYARYGKTSNGTTILGGGSASYYMGDITNPGDIANNYKVSESTFAYGEQIKEIELDVGSSTGEVYQNYNSWATNTNYAITKDPSPGANYIQTYQGGNPGENITFILKGKFKIKRVGGTVPNGYNWLEIQAIVKVGTYYLFFNNVTTKFEWSTTIQTVYGANNVNAVASIPAVGSEYSYALQWGAQNITEMDAIPVDGAVEVYIYWDQYTFIDGQVLDVAGLSVTDLVVTTDAQEGTYGATSRALELDLYKDGEMLVYTKHLVENKPGGNLVEGGVEISRKVKFDSGAIYRNNTIVTWDGTTGTMWDSWTYDYVAKWRNRNEVNSVNILPVFKGVEMIALHPSNKKVLRCTLIAKNGTTSPFRFSWMFKYDGIFYISNGFKLEANSGMLVGEFIAIDYELSNASLIAGQSISSTGGGVTEVGNPNEAVGTVGM